MDSLQDPEIRVKYEKCKYRVKLWENLFKKQHGRIPSKLDIREADVEVRNAYKIYFRLKTGALEESLMNIEGFNEAPPAIPVDDTKTRPIDLEVNCNLDINTWGLHLNKDTTNVKLPKAEKSNNNVNLSFSQKLFKGAKSSKRLPRKSLSFNRKKSESDTSKPQFLSQPECSTSFSESPREYEFNLIQESDPKLNIVNENNIKQASTKSINFIQNIVNKPIRTLDIGWVNRVAEDMTNSLNNSNITKGDYDSDDVIGNSEDEDEYSTSLNHVSKKFKIDEPTVKNNPLITVDAEPKRLDFSNIFPNKELIKSVDEKTMTMAVTKTPVTIKKSTRKKRSQPVRKTKKDSSDNSKVEAEDIDKTKKQDENYELEYSVTPRIVTVPRIQSIKQIMTTKTQTGQAIGMNEKKLQGKIEKGTLNDNFVQLNMKKKIYVRGKSTRTFSKFKKQQWKNKKVALYGPDMDMRGCDGGQFTCFNCGEVGHFARNCKVAKGDNLLPLQEDEELCPYPTLEEAAKMAKESVLAVRKPLHVEESVSVQQDELFDDEFDDELVGETKRLEQEIAKINVQNYIDSTVFVKPYYELEEDGGIKETPQELYETLHMFGHDTFRDGQEQAVMRILSGKSTLVTLSTGSGKSLCYQLPAYLYSQREPCISLIISPLVSLMEDQVSGIPNFLKAACLHTNQTKNQREKIMEAISMGNLNILLVSPEAVVAGEKSSGFGSLLRKLPPIAFACIDEAHCVSQWSHNFRPSYLKICKVLRDRLGINIILGLTATATRATSDSIIRHLNILDGRDGIINDIPLPDNLKLTVSKDRERDQALLALLSSERFVSCQSIIVYCTRREECQRVATFLRTCLKDERVTARKRKRFSLQAEAYHAGMTASRRKIIQKAFMAGELRIVVATVAFGMGINKSDIRAVIHYNMPMSFESYVQEVGRAGRDGLPAHCHLFLDSEGKDENELSRHIHANSTDRHVIRKLLQSCFTRCSCKAACPRHEVAFSIQETVQALDIPEENIETLLCYLELHEKQYVELLSHAYVSCKVVSYGGPNEIRQAARDCPPLAMALALHAPKDSKDGNVFEFPVVDVASAIGWDSGICKHKLKNLEWITVNNQPKRSKLSVEFSNLGFRLMAPGNLSDNELDDALDTLFERVKQQERTATLQLHTVHTTLKSFACPTFKLCLLDKEFDENDNLIKSKIREYFDSIDPLESLPDLPKKPLAQEQIVNDIRALVSMYRDNAFTGRAVARIVHGIQSPNYPAFIWGRCKFWRTHLGSDFNDICQIATKEILNMRRS